MKNISLVVLLVFSAFSFAQEQRSQWSRSVVVMDKAKIKVASDEVTLVRTAQTPKVVTLELEVPMQVKAKRTKPNELTFISERNCFNELADNRWALSHNLDCPKYKYCLKEDREGNCTAFYYRRRCQSRISSSTQVVDDGLRNGFLSAGTRTETVRLRMGRMAPLERGETEVLVLKGHQRRAGRDSIVFNIESIQTKECYRANFKRFLFGERIRLRPQADGCKAQEMFYASDAVSFEL